MAKLFINIITRSNSIVRHGDSLSVSFILRVFKFVCFAELSEDASISKKKNNTYQFMLN